MVPIFKSEPASLKASGQDEGGRVGWKSGAEVVKGLVSAGGSMFQNVLQGIWWQACLMQRHP